MSVKKKAVLFDRDGVLNVDSGYVYRYKNLCWIDGAREAVARLTKEGWLLFVVTNQSGVARGLYTEQDVMELHRQMNKELGKYGGNITEFFFCPHLNGAKISRYNVDCDCRKPKPGMIIQAINKYSLIKENTFLIGDSERDIEAAIQAGIKGFLFEGSNLNSFLKNSLPELKDESDK